MDDLFFERKLMEDEVIDTRQSQQNQEPVFTLGKQLKKGFDDNRFFLNDYLNSRTKAIFIDFDVVIDTYYQNKYPEKDYDEIYEMTSKFMEKLSDDNILAYVVYGDGECLIDVVEGKEAYISNCSGFVTPEIQDRKLINFDEFKGKSISTIGDSDAFIEK